MTGGQWALTTSLTLQGARQPLNAPVVSLQNSYSAVQTLPYGTGTGTMTIAVEAPRTLAAGASETFDLYTTGTDLPDVFGDAAAFRVLRAWAIWIVSGGDAAGVTINGGASNALNLTFTGTTPGETVYPGGPPAVGGSTVGVAVTATAKNVRVTNNGTAAVNYVLVLAGSQSSAGLAAGPPGVVYP